MITATVCVIFFFFYGGGMDYAGKHEGKLACLDSFNNDGTS